jgi:hypothetical protein
MSDMNASRDSLSEALRAWRVTPPSDPGFRQGVWRRIGRKADGVWPAYFRAHTAALAAVAFIVLGAAAYTGSAVAHSQARADRETIVAAYLVDLDPRAQALLKP